MQKILAILIVAAAALYVGYAFARRLRVTSKRSCGGCHDCSVSAHEQASLPVVQIQQARKQFDR
jgi:uncharacterized membrane protein SpoIIM required for sporulation